MVATACARAENALTVLRAALFLRLSFAPATEVLAARACWEAIAAIVSVKVRWWSWVCGKSDAPGGAAGLEGPQIAALAQSRGDEEASEE